MKGFYFYIFTFHAKEESQNKTELLCNILRHLAVLVKL